MENLLLACSREAGCMLAQEPHKVIGHVAKGIQIAPPAHCPWPLYPCWERLSGACLFPKQKQLCNGDVKHQHFQSGERSRREQSRVKGAGGRIASESRQTSESKKKGLWCVAGRQAETEECFDHNAE